jgi:signal transduction histidine kinase/ActR/RegA family two-component response regulator
MGNGPNLMARRSDGTEFPAEISLSPLVTAEGLMVVSTVRDVTERQQIEERLRQSEKMEAVGRLASGVAHDFNNLLSVVIGYGDMLLRGLPDGDRRRGTVEQILQAGYRAATLTQQLLAYGRRQVSQPRVLDLNSLVLDMGKMLRRMIGEQIEFDTDLDPKLGRVKMDQSQMEQVVMNLVINARDAMPDGGRLLIETRNARLGDADVRGRDAIGPGLYVMVAVTDAGVGMDAATQARIFEPFFTTKEEGKGTGLGLATVYANVRQGGGDVWVRSEPGRGTTFKVYLPRVEDPAETVRPTAEGTELPRGSETILVVEDEEMVRRLVSSALEASGYRILAAGGSLEAIHLIGEHAGPIHLLVTDVIMPGMTGSELAGKIVGLSPGMKVLYMSGYAGNAIAKHGVIGPDIAFLQKPFAPDALVRKVREVLDARTEGRA